MTIEREEFEARMTGLKTDLNACGNSMRAQMKELKEDNRENFKSVWKAIDGMLIKVGIVVTICSSIVMAVFKMVEQGK